MLKPGAAGQGGMTIVEVLIAIAIVALVLAFAGPSARNWIQNSQIRNGAESILGGIKKARFEAINRNTTVAFQLTDANSTRWRVCLFDTSIGDCAVGPADIATGAPEGSQNARVGVENVFTSYTIALAAGSNVPALVAFDSFGRISPSSPTNIARLELRNPTLSAADERRLDVAIGLGGDVLMCDPKLSKATNPQGCQ